MPDDEYPLHFLNQPDPMPTRTEPVHGTTLLNQGSDALLHDVLNALKTIQDPEIPTSIYALGLIYKVDIDEDNNVQIDMTLTTPNCPVAQTFPAMVQTELAKLDAIGTVTVTLVWDPPWTPDRMSDATRIELGLL